MRGFESKANVLWGSWTNLVMLKLLMQVRLTFYIYGYC